MELLNNFLNNRNRIAFIYKDINYNYEWLHTEIIQCIGILNDTVQISDTVELCSDYSPKTIAMFIALVYKKAIIVPLVNISTVMLQKYDSIIKPNARITISNSQELYIEKFEKNDKHPLVKQLTNQKSSGLIIMSSGSTGVPKAIIHDLDKIVESQPLTQTHKTILTFLLFDHIGGINSMLNALVNGNTLVLPALKDIVSIAHNIENSKVNVLITSPSFLNLILISEVYNKYDLSSLKHINYGSEIMPEHVLIKLSEIFPSIKFSQSYGMSELGVVKTKTKNNTSLAIKIDENSSNYRIVDGKLEIRTNTTMLGYLNAKNPFTLDGWVKTGDMVQIEEDGWLKILGRESDIINIGGQKVFPAEVENVILQIPEVYDVIVYAEPNAILGNIIKARVSLVSRRNQENQLIALRHHCSKYLENFKIPQKFEFVDQIAHCRRFKKVRKMGNTNL